MTKVRLNSIYPPAEPVGGIENHYGVPFTVVATAEKDEKGKPVCVLETEISDEDAAPMVEAGRVTIIEAPKSPAAPPAGPRSLNPAPAAPAAPAEPPKAPAAPAAPADPAAPAK